MRWARPIVVFVLFAGACAPAPTGVGDEQDDGKADRGGRPAFREVDPTHTSATFRRSIVDALRLLDSDEAAVARLTAQSIRDGRVAVDELADLTCWDFDRLRRELELPYGPADFPSLRQRGSAVLAAIAAQIDGYMWSDRVYVARGLAPRRLAATPIHEVNHVLNRSEVGYWDDLPTSAFLHEYRAFYAERLFDPETYRGVDLVAYVIDLYALDGKALSPSARAQPLTPRLLPDGEAWRARHLGDDPVDVEADCPTYAEPPRDYYRVMMRGCALFVASRSGWCCSASHRAAGDEPEPGTATAAEATSTWRCPLGAPAARREKGA
jgi:hypothetical protein